MKIKLLINISLFLALNLCIDAQTLNNLDRINILIGHSIEKSDSLTGGEKSINLTYTSSQPLEILKPKIIQLFNERGYILNTSGAKSGISLNYNLLSVSVGYMNSSSDGFFGGVMLERQIKVAGSLIVTRSDKISKPFEFTETTTDTVNLDQISTLENKSLPFTQGQIPSQPLLSTFWEPILVVGTLIVTVILLFTVRSK